MFPIWLLGAMAAEIQRDLAFGAAALGGAVAIFQGVSAATSIPAGVLVQRHGWRSGALATITLFVIAMVGIATLSTSWTMLAIWLAIAGVASGFSSPTANLGLARQVAPSRQGLAFGIKQAAVPAGTLIAGLAIPVVALTIGWRWAYGLAALAAVPLALTTPRRTKQVKTTRARLRSQPQLMAPLVVLAIGAGLGTAATNSVGAFFVVSAIAGGIDPATAGFVLAAGAATSVLVRVLIGWSADRRVGGHFNVVAGMMAIGALGVAGLGYVDGTGPLLGVAVLAFGLGWSWNGLFDFALVRRMAVAPATATGVAQTGKYLGGMLGPLAFGVTVERSSFGVAWTAAGVVLVVAAAMVVLGRHRLRAALARAPEVHDSVGGGPNEDPPRRSTLT